MSCRKVLPGASSTKASRSGFCLSIRRSMLTTPYIAPVGSPARLVSGGSAWNARNRYEEPSIRTSLATTAPSALAERLGRHGLQEGPQRAQLGVVHPGEFLPRHEGIDVAAVRPLAFAHGA